MSEWKVQTRSEETGLSFFDTFRQAWDHANKDRTVWKISFELPSGERIRLRVWHRADRSNATLSYEPIDVLGEVNG